MASGSSGLINPTSKAFDFASEEVLCEYDEFAQESSNGVISDPVNGKDLSKDFQKSRMTSYSPSALNSRLDESPYRDTFSMVEMCMKRHTDDIMRFLEGISSRLSHLELYCYNVDKSVGEMRSDMGRDYEETDSKLKSLEKHIVEVSRSVQILRDKQELAETQKELAKLQRAQIELSSPNAHRHNVELSTSPASEHHRTDDTSEVQNQHLAIVLHHQVPLQQQSSPTRPVEVPQPLAPSSQFAPRHTTQHQNYYVTSSPCQVQIQASQGQYLTSNTQYQTPQPPQQEFNLMRLQPVSQAPPQVHRFIQSQQRPQQPQQMLSAQQSIQQPPTPVQSRPHSASGYPPNQPSKSLPQAPREAVSSSILMRAPFSSMSQHMVSRADVMPNGYGGRPVQQQPPPHQIKADFGSPYGDMYTSVGPHQSLSPATAAAYMMYGNEEVRRQPPPQSQFQQGGSYPPATVPLQHPQHISMIRNPNQAQVTRNHPGNDMIDKLVNMGFRGDHVVAVIQRMEESGQAVEFNTVLNKLNVQSSGPHIAWSG